MPPRRLPDAEGLADYAQRKVRDERTGQLRPMTYTEMAADWERRTGIVVTPVAFRKAIARAGLAQPRRPRHRTLPWSPIKDSHNMHYFAQRLRLLARRMQGETLRAADEAKLNGLHTTLRDAAETSGRPVSIAYEYDDPEGFQLVGRRKGDIHIGEDVWIVPPRTPDAGAEPND
jgi:hypothetical protein